MATRTKIFRQKVQQFTRTFIRISVIIFFLSSGGGFMSMNAQRLTRDLNIDIMINQVGYVPGASKNVDNISEYWTPMVAHTLWLMAEFTQAQ